MLELLRIRQLALIEDLELEFGPSLNVLTGETGAGKSFIVRALDFLLGEKLTTNLIRPGRDKARVEALFVVGDPAAPEEVLIRRELFAETGRSRVWINDDLASQDALKQLRKRLIIHASQHSQQQLRLPSFHVRLLDRFLSQPELTTQKERHLAVLSALVEEEEQLEARLKDLLERRELLEYQRAEIAKVVPVSGEEEELEARKQTLRDQTLVQENARLATELLCASEIGLHETLGRLRKAVSELLVIHPELGSDATALDSMVEQAQDLERKLRGLLRVQNAQNELEGIEARLWALAQLKRKLKRPLADIVRLREEIEANLSLLDSSALDRKHLERRQEAARNELVKTLEALDADRRQTARTLTEKLHRELLDLGFSEHLKIEFAFTAQEIFPGIMESRPRLLWAPNPGQPFQALDEIASGGELSRVLLAVTGLMADANNPTLIFDEVDAGIGGMTLNRVGERLANLAKTQQVLLITHWPQLAALGQKHFQIRKEVVDGATFTRCTPMDGPERQQELERMTGGAWKSDNL
ncbi:MAG TPA: DNA repair protein RecN [Desulfonatronum sp.]|nr:DNA repair protein RecN [Desulfonatronum sp.]